MTTEEFNLLNDFITERCGICYKEKQKYIFQQKIFKRLEINNLTNFTQYYDLIRQENVHNELQELYNTLTVNETYFFREKEHLNEIVEVLIPEMLKSRPNRRIKILSAGCSTGEEPYSLAILLKESKNNLNLNVDICAADLSKKAIDIAQNAIYKKISLTFRVIESNFIDKYFESKGKNYKLKDEIKNLVSFSQTNFFDYPESQVNDKFDIVICRNVMIYFNHDYREKLVNKFYKILSPKGYLILSNTENLNNIKNDFKLTKKDKVFIYSKEL